MEILYFDILPSTQTYLSEQLKAAKLISPICVVADKQTAGIGSRGNVWEQAREALSFSFAIKLSELPQDLPLQSASIFFGFIFKEVLVSLGFDVWLKWPNDLYIGKQKAGGVMSSVCREDIVCGIGLNIYGGRFAYLGAAISREEVLEKFFAKIKNTSRWKHIFSKYELEFYKNFGFSFHHQDGVLDLEGAILLPDGGIYLNGEKIYNIR
ncbi:biotin--[acetyl-CoA-carboxylase] ligase [Helicobacter sp. 12S02634-8]|uniref:biotin--[acetyl-CoA-carboxylase] ligase n=1 Tax=Helicobacter sp. 12S02634-8 TaxID=1476199 RepID=UPI000BA74E53|nr:biotin--[acetyl-CoA-carboxylase] ligase [Helicobacter sp. 12S02634-8]PAF48428.1 biotin--[acetyl-CoA-carboxylase] ligase [Helicobacter sp. 12S02634-8]